MTYPAGAPAAPAAPAASSAASSPAAGAASASAVTAASSAPVTTAPDDLDRPALATCAADEAREIVCGRVKGPSCVDGLRTLEQRSWSRLTSARGDEGPPFELDPARTAHFRVKGTGDVSADVATATSREDAKKGPNGDCCFARCRATKVAKAGKPAPKLPGLAGIGGPRACVVFEAPSKSPSSVARCPAVVTIDGKPLPFGEEASGRCCYKLPAGSDRGMADRPLDDAPGLSVVAEAQCTERRLGDPAAAAAPHAW